RRRICGPAGHAGTREAPECRGQDVGRAELFERSLPLPQHPRLSSPDFRRVRAVALLLGHRHHAHAVQLPRMRDDVYRRIAVAEGKGPRPRYGPRCMRLARLEASGARLRRGVRRGIARITMTGTSLGGAQSDDEADVIWRRPGSGAADGPVRLYRSV